MPVFNAETTASLSDHLMSYLEKRFLERLEVKFHFNKFAMQKKLKKGEGKTVKWNKWANVSDSTTALTSGVSPDGINLSSTNQTATLSQYGQFATATDFLILTAINDTLKDYVDLLAYAGGKSLDALLRNEVDVNATTQMAAASANEAAVQADPTAILIANEIRKAVKTLRNNDADEFEDGMYRGIIHPFGEFDLLSESNAGSHIQTVQHTDHAPIEKGMIGSLYGVRFFRSSHIRAVAPNTNTYRHIITGPMAYGAVSIDSGDLKIIIKNLGSAGSEDPLDQRATVGYKFWHAAKLLDASRVVRISAYGA